MKSLILLACVSGLFDIPVISDPLLVGSGVLDYPGVMRSALVFHYKKDEGGTRLTLPLELSLVPSRDNLFHLMIPFVWWTPPLQSRRQGLGDMELGWARQLFRLGPNFGLLGVAFSLPTTTDTLKPEHRRIHIRPYGAYTLVLGRVNGFAEFGARTPLYDAEKGEVLGRTWEYDYGVALRVRPLRSLELGVEFRGADEELVPGLSLYPVQDVDLCGGLVIPIEGRENTLLAGARLRF